LFKFFSFEKGEKVDGCVFFLAVGDASLSPKGILVKSGNVGGFYNC
jgi:hypothetical protein